jgi:thioredoxin-like negative regulator of GroEL
MTKHSNKKGKRITKGKKVKTITVESLLEQATEALQSVQLEDAQELYQQALALQPNNTDIMDALADVCMQIGDLTAALALLQQSIAMAPDTNGIKWLYVAQLLHGSEALVAYQRGIQVMEAKLSLTPNVSATLIFF